MGTDEYTHSGSEVIVLRATFKMHLYMGQGKAWSGIQKIKGQGHLSIAYAESKGSKGGRTTPAAS